MHTQDHILQGVCVRDALMNRGWVWTRRPRSPHPTLEMLHPSDGAPLRGWEHGGLPRSTAGSPLRPSPFHLPVSSGFPTTNHWQRKRGKKHRRREKGKFWPWGGELVHSQLQVNPVCLSKFGWCVREPRVNITLFFPLLPEVMDVKQRRFLHARQSTILFILSLIRFAASNGTGLDEDVETS